MYSSLDQIDIITKDANGNEHYIQTDHRDSQEIEEQPEISLLFAIVRMLNPLRLKATGIVEYRAKTMPPLFLQEAIAAAGGILFVGIHDAKQIPYKQTARDLEELVNEAFHQLAQKTLSHFALPLVPELTSLEKLEQQIEEEGMLDKEEEIIKYWETVFQLSAVGGEILREKSKGTWQAGADPKLSSLPLVFLGMWEGQEAKINLLGKAIKFLENGEEDSVSTLVSVALSKAKNN